MKLYLVIVFANDIVCLNVLFVEKINMNYNS